jgi:GNAT superfamily N-acetyltransferase
MADIRLAESEEEVRRCFPVMAQLRPHLSEQEFVERVGRQRERAGYALAFVEDAGAVCAVAGFRISEWLAWGKSLYVDDLVTDEANRSKGYGDALFDWLAVLARREGCEQLHLDSGVQRFAAHRFYLRKRMIIASHHFSMPLALGEGG